MRNLQHEVLTPVAHSRENSSMKKACFGAIHGKSNGVISESWQGGGMCDAAFAQRYIDGYEVVHCCQDPYDEDVFHYVFQKTDSNEPLGYCGMCRVRLLTTKEPKETLTIKVPTGIPDLFGGI